MLKKKKLLITNKLKNNKTKSDLKALNKLKDNEIKLVSIIFNK